MPAICANSIINCCPQVVVLIVLLVLVPLYYWYMLQPFYMQLGKESRRVAELLSQLPKSIDVQGEFTLGQTTWNHNQSL